MKIDSKTLRLMIGLLALLVSMPMNAYDFECDGIYYDIKEDHELTVVAGDNKYQGEVVIPNEVAIYSTMFNVTKIGQLAFYNCTELTSVTIPSSVTYISGDSFYGCSNLASLKLEGDNQYYDSRDNCNAIIQTSTNTLIVGCNNSTIPSSVTTIGDCAFAGRSGLKSITIPNSVMRIRYLAFYGCTGLTSVEIPARFIMDYVFQGCTNLTSVTLLGSVYNVGAQVFRDCTNLSSVTITHGVNELGDQMFMNCTSLTSIDIPGSVNYLGGSAFQGCTNLSSVNISHNITSLAGTFDGCCSLTSITIPRLVSYIGSSTFYGCKSLKTIVTEIETPCHMAWGACSEDVYQNVELIVPKGTKAKYQSADGWNQFANITEEGTTDLRAITTPSDPTAIYDLQGQRLTDKPRKGVYIQNGKKVVIKIN